MYKRLFIMIACAALLGGCASMGKRETIVLSEDREAPYYFANGETNASFKANAVFRDLEIEGVLLIRKTGNNEYRVRILGPMGSRVADLTMKGTEFSYNYLLPDFDSGLVKTRVEKFIMMIVYPPGKAEKMKMHKTGLVEVRRQFKSGSSVYQYQYDNAYPHAVLNGSVSLEYSDYRPYGVEGESDALPFAITASDSLAGVVMELVLLNLS